MKSTTNEYSKSFIRAASVLLAAAALLVIPKLASAQVLAPGTTSPPYNKTYGQWAGEWWQWFMQLPLTNSVGAVHPGIDAGQAAFDITEGQTGNVWFLAAPFGTVSRTATVPANKAIFFALLNAEASSLEEPPFYGATAEEQAAAATYFADHIVGLFCEIDGVRVNNLTSFRAPNPQISFVAPTPWIFGSTGGAGTSSGDGYYIFLKPLSPGQHTIHFGGALKFTKKDDGFKLNVPLDMTYTLTVK